ncbi:heterokaryon incompatibility protein-domain-containing protein [Scleroderma yunnanense]
MSRLQQLRSLFSFKQNDPAPYCTTCAALDIRRILRDGLPRENAASLGFLLDIIKKSDHCILCRLIATLIRRQWRLDDHPNIDLQGIECTLSAFSCGTLDPNLEESKQSHRLYIHASTRPSEVSKVMGSSNADLSLQIQLMEEDCHKVSRRRDLHGRRMKDMIDIGMIKRWVHLCETAHGNECESVWWRTKNEGLPSFVRMVDVVHMALVLAPPDCRYVALSYVWGGPGDAYWTTTTNVDARCHPDGLDKSILPATIRDSILLVQQVGERYLWIDALCIIQDSLEDKADQIHIMDLIYSRATFTICAAGGDSARAGLPGLTAGTRTCQQHIEVIQGLHLALPLPSVLESVSQSIWNSRGWTFQELVLSRRRVIFTQDQVYFECIKDIWCEDVVAESPTVKFSGTPMRTLRTGMFLRESLAQSMEIRNYASNIKQYTQRRLTQESDIVAAITALTNAMAGRPEVTGKDPKDSFRFGMWITNLDYSLLWQPNLGATCYFRRTVTDREHSHWPSWAWVGWKGAINYDQETQLTGYLFPTTHPPPNESLVPAWYMATEGGVIRLGVQKISPVKIISDDPEQIPPPRYIPPMDCASDMEIGFSPPAGTLIFRTQCAHFQVLRLDDVEQSEGEAEVYAVFQVLSLDPSSPGCVGRIALPSSIPSFADLEFIVLSRCSGSPGLYDELFWGSTYYGCILHVMAIQKTRDPRIRERVGVGAIVEAAWLKSGSKAEETVVLLA